jgi:integrase
MAWKSTGQPGVRYREHLTRKHLGQADKYYALRTYVNGKAREEGLGWASDGWTVRKAAALLAELRQAQSTGAGPQTLAEKRAVLAARQEEADRSTRSEAAQAMTLGDFLKNHYLPHAKKHKGTWHDDELRIDKNIVPALGQMPMRAITRADVQRFLDGLAESGSAPATVKHHLAILRQAYNIAAHTSVDGVALMDGPSPLDGMKSPRLHNIRERFLSYTEADLLTDAAKAEDQDLHDAIVIALNTGLRLGEVMRMEWVDVDLTHGVLTVRDGPRSKPGGKAHVNAEAHAVLEDRMATRAKKSRRVFPGTGIDGRALTKRYRNLVDRIGLNDEVTDARHRVVFHTLRHTFASWLALAGTDILRIKVLMRHKTLAMTDRYSHLIPDATKAAVHNLRPPRGS